MANLSSIIDGIRNVIQDESIASRPQIIHHVNDAIQNIAAGIRMPNGEISPPLPDLYQFNTVNTTTLPYVALPSDYQRYVFNICDDTFNKILPPRGGDYYAFARFLKQINFLNLQETGEVYAVCIKGTKLYYQGIPTAAWPIGVHYYRKPALVKLDGDIPEGIPEHLQHSIIKHYVVKDIMGEKIEDGNDNQGVGTKYHTAKFFEEMIDLIDFIGRDEEAQYYGDESYQDRGRVDG